MESYLGWIGGKRALRKEILESFPKQHIGRYVEVFGGAGWVLFAKEKAPKQLEVYNDANGDLVNLFRCVKYHCNALQDELDWLLSSREQFFDCKEQINSPGLTDIQRAARFFFVVKISFGSNYRSFATSSKSPHRSIQYLRQIQDRLQGVVIEHKDFADLIKIYDRKDALFYLDPPYVGTERYYQAAFSAADHRRLATALEKISGKFLLSYNDDPLICNLYSAYHIERISRKNTLSNSSNTKNFRELLIRNY